MTKGFFFEDEANSPVVKVDGDRSILSRAGCSGCQMKRNIKSPQMEPHGEGKRGILLLGEAPGREEDEKDEQFVGRSGDKLKWALGQIGINMDRDCHKQNVVMCWPGKDNKYPGDAVADRCRLRLEGQIRGLKPKVIVTLGIPAMKAILLDDAPLKVQSQMKSVSGGIMTRMRGRIIPSRTWGCPVVVSMHPSWYLRNDKEEELLVDDMSLIWEALEWENKPAVITKMNINEKVLLTDYGMAIEYLESALDCEEEIVYDFETTSLSPYENESRILTVNILRNFGIFDSKGSHIFCVPVDWPGIWTDEQKKNIKILLQKIVQSKKSCKIAHNVQFEHQWGEQKLHAELRGDTWDTMVTAHVLDGRSKTTNLDFQVWQMTGETYGQNLDKANLLSHRLEDVAIYGGKDAYYEYMLKKEQERILNEDGNEGLKDAVEFYQKGILPLSKMTMRGLGIDVERGEELLAEFSDEIKKIDKKIMDSEFTRKYEKKKGKKFNPGSGDHVGEILFNICGIKPIKRTEKGKPSVDESALKMIAENEKSDVGDFVFDVLRGRKLKKTRGTYIEPILNKRDSNDVIHPLCNLHIANSFRSSMENPNFQNIPVRDPDMARVREMFVPHIGQWYLEGDVKGLEIAMMAMYSKDRKLTKYLIDGYDLHREWAAKMYEKPIDEVTDEERDKTKSNFVFAEFYGDYWEQIAPNFPHVSPKFIKELERELRSEFSGVFKWRKKRVDEYYDKGYADNYLGFRRLAPMKRNELLNFPIQSTGFLLVLAGIVDMDAVLDMKSVMVAQVHDSVLFDSFLDDIDWVVDEFSGLMDRRRYDWMGEIPLRVEWSLGRNWGKMEKI